jgi:DNA-binding transcriptional MocR family regulator
MRQAWAVVPDHAVERVVSVKMQMTSNSSFNELLTYEMLTKGYYYEFTEHAQKLLPERVKKANAILNTHLHGVARWQPENLIHTVYLTFEDRVHVNRLIFENPYYIIISKSENCRWQSIFINYAGMSIDEFEDCILHCAKSIKTQGIIL